MTDYIELLDRFFRGGTSTDEESSLQEWLDGKPEPGEELYEYFVSRWESSTGHMDPSVKARIRSRIEEHIEEECDTDMETGANATDTSGIDLLSGSGRRTRWDNLAAWTVAVCVAIAACVGWLKYVRAANVEGKPFEVFTERGQKANIILPDGTRVWLNSASRLIYGSDYNTNRRDVSLTGEGYFEVAHDADRTFCVATAGYTVEALGTSFNIRSYSDDRYSFTTLIEGKLRIENDDGFSTILLPLESLSFDTENERFRSNCSYRTRFAGDWRQNELVIDRGTTLEELTGILSRQYNIGFGFLSDSIKQMRFEGVIKDSNLINVLQLIELSGEVSYTIEDNMVILDKKQ